MPRQLYTVDWDDSWFPRIMKWYEGNYRDPMSLGEARKEIRQRIQERISEARDMEYAARIKREDIT